jgi:hypothetical protein
VLKELKELPGELVLKETVVHKALRVPKELLEPLVFKVTGVHKELRGLVEQPVLSDRWEIMAHKEPKDLRVREVPRERKVQEDRKELPDLLEVPEYLV